MRICLDVSPAVHHRAGIGRYTQELAVALLAADADNEYVAFYNRPSEAQVAAPLGLMPRLTMPLSDKPWRLRVLLAQLLHFSQDGLFRGSNLFHATDHLLPYLSRMRSVFTLHDLTFQLYPQAHSAWNHWFLSLMMPRFLHAAGAVVADSECTRRDAARLYEIDAANISVIYPGVSSQFRPANLDAVQAIRAKYSLPEHFILYVGTIEPRKNLTTLIEAFHHLQSAIRNLHVVIVGKKGWLYEGFFRRLLELGLEERVHLTGYVPDEDLPALYSAADLFVFPSLYEGFGLPPLEAMACGTPVVASNTSSLPEAVGEAGVLVDPRDAGGLAMAMEQTLTNQQLRAEMKAKGLERARAFTWEKAARQVLQVYEKLLRR